MCQILCNRDVDQVIGHEITHGFDDQGRTFDSTGNLANWWERTTEENYLDKAQCIIWQYGNYTARPPVSINLNGINTQGENIADNGGIKEAYNAYQRFGLYFRWVCEVLVIHVSQLDEEKRTGAQASWLCRVLTRAGEIKKRKMLVVAKKQPYPRCSGSALETLGAQSTGLLPLRGESELGPTVPDLSG